MFLSLRKNQQYKSSNYKSDLSLCTVLDKTFTLLLFIIDIDNFL